MVLSTNHLKTKSHFGFLLIEMHKCYSIVRIEFTPVVEISVNRGHYFPQETTKEGPTLINAWTIVSFNIEILNLLTLHIVLYHRDSYERGLHKYHDTIKN